MSRRNTSFISTRLIRTKPHQSFGIILRGCDLEGFNESTILNARKALEKDQKRPYKPKKPLGRDDKENLIDSREPERLMEEFERIEDFKMCFERYKPDHYVMDGQKLIDLSVGENDQFLMIGPSPSPNPRRRNRRTDIRPRTQEPVDFVQSSIIENNQLLNTRLDTPRDQSSIRLEHLTHPTQVSTEMTAIDDHRSSMHSSRYHEQTAIQPTVQEEALVETAILADISSVVDHHRTSTRLGTPRDQNSIRLEHLTHPTQVATEMTAIDDHRSSMHSSRYHEQTAIQPTVQEETLVETAILADISSVVDHHRTSLNRHHTSITTNQPEQDEPFTMLRTTSPDLNEHSQLIGTYHPSTITQQQEDNVTWGFTTVPDASIDYHHTSGIEDGEEPNSTFSIYGDSIETLLRVCKQDDIMDFENLLDAGSKPTKLGEGSYGEVFSVKIDGVVVALKIIPFTLNHEQPKLMNDDYMKTVSSILPETIISGKLSSLATNQDNQTSAFVNVVKMCVVKGEYPKPLLNAWNVFKKNHGKDALNESPNEYSSSSQLYMAIALANGGTDLEKFKIQNEDEALSIILQAIMGLRVAEKELEFEHRDLHIGNILVSRSKDNAELRFTIEENEYRVLSNGVRATIIDFTNSRISTDGVTIFLDLSTDQELFNGPKEEYQCEIYRMMKEANNNDWSKFNPRTNCMWIHYLSDKILKSKNSRGILNFKVKRRKDLEVVFEQVLGCQDLNEFMQLEATERLFSKYLT